MGRDEMLQSICRSYLMKLRYIGRKHGIDVDAIIRANKRNECEATMKEVEMLARCVDDERVSRAELPSILGESYRRSEDGGAFHKIKRLRRVGIYSKVSALLYRNKRK